MNIPVQVISKDRPSIDDECARQEGFKVQQLCTKRIVVHATVLSSVGLAACGGSGGGASSSSSVPNSSPQTPGSPPESVAKIDEVSAARFLGQAGFGGDQKNISKVMTVGYGGWLDEQFDLPRFTSVCDQLINTGGATSETRGSAYRGLVWQRLMRSPDALRQRIWLALSEILVISVPQLNSTWRGFMGAAYVDLLEKHCFGTYRELLEAVTLSPAMGLFLNMRGSRAEDGTGRQPDENFARESLQLFSVGLYLLNEDGSQKLDVNGKPIETYSQSDVSELAKVFTGWDFDGYSSTTHTAYIRKPMAHNPAYFSKETKTVLDNKISGSATGIEALRQALDILSNHPNVGPFIGRQLIQRLVCSNPSHSYVKRISAVWRDNGFGERGDLKSVIRAILLDPEAREISTSDFAGKLREPIQRLIQWGRTFNVSSADSAWGVPDTVDPATRLGQGPLQSPSVFNFFRPGYVPPNSRLGDNSLTAPEFQITNETSVASYINFMYSTISGGFGNVVPDYSYELAMASDEHKLVRGLAARLAGGNLSDSTVNRITTAVSSINVVNDKTKLDRVRNAIFLIMCSPEYLVQK